MKKRVYLFFVVLLVLLFGSVTFYAEKKEEVKVDLVEKFTEDISFTDTELEKVLFHLTKLTGIKFYAVSDIAGLKISISIARGETIQDLIDYLAAHYGINYMISDDGTIYFLIRSYPDDMSAGETADFLMMDAAPAMEKSMSRADTAVSFYGSHNINSMNYFNTEEYSRIYENSFFRVLDNPQSIFSIDVDTASYTNIRRYINKGQLPPRDAVRIEEMINYFDYDYPAPEGDIPFSIYTEAAECPWNRDHRLVLIGLQAKKIETEELPPNNLVFLVDVSASMDSPDKLPLLKKALILLADELREEDRISLVTYSGYTEVVLDSVSGKEKDKIKKAIDNLEPWDSTAGGAGIVKAYEIAKKNYLREGNNRVILATDGDFNVGVSSTGELVRLIEEKREEGIFLTVLGFGTGNYKDSRMEELSNKGNGNYAYIDNLLEAKKVLIRELGGTLYTIAKDVKIQVEFNPAKVREYRLIGYENRVMENQDFDDDRKDAGELGAGHSVTALYELVPADGDDIDLYSDLVYLQTIIKEEAYQSNELLTIKLRYKEPDENESRLISAVLADHIKGIADASENFRFAASVAQFGMLLLDSEFKGDASYQGVIELAKDAKGKDEYGYRTEFIRLVEMIELIVQTGADKY